jgi:hypothetical protein
LTPLNACTLLSAPDVINPLLLIAAIPPDGGPTY